MLVYNDLVRGEQSGTRWDSWLKPCATRRKVAGSIPDGAIDVFIDLILAAALWARIDSASNRNEYQRYLLGGGGGKGGRCVGLTILPRSCADCL